MANESPKNFVENIHKVDYESWYAGKPINHTGLLCRGKEETEKLNGWWNYGADPYDSCLRGKWYEEKYQDEKGRNLPVDYSYDRWDRIYVPACWNLQKEKLFLYEGSMVYTRRFTYVSQGEERVFIRFEACNYEAKVFLNRQYLGSHKGGSTPFNIEVTGLLEKENRLLVVANNTRKRNAVPCENTDWFNYGGIYRDVELIRLPETYIRQWSAALVTGSGFGQVRVKMVTGGEGKNGRAVVRISELGVEEGLDVVDGAGEVLISCRPELWSPDKPKLYDVEVCYGKDIVKDRVGFREIRVVGQDILLNGERILLKGVCSHEDSVGNGKSMADEEILDVLRVAKEMNCNLIRLAHYPHSGRVSQLADELGMLLWEEIPVYWAIEFESRDTYEDAENQLLELIKRDANRASVIIWSVGNENADTEARLTFMRSLAQKAKETDPDRLVSAACLTDHANHRIHDRLAEHLDIIGINEYFGWYDPDFSKLVKLFENSRPEKPVIITEFGADARAGARGTVHDLCTEDCQAEVYRKQVEVFGRIPYVKGTCPWILFDFRSPRRLHELQDSYNIKGLLSSDRKSKKPAFAIMQEFYRTWGE